MRHKRRFDYSVRFGSVYSCGGNLPYGAAQVMCVLEVEAPDTTDRATRHLVGPEIKVQSNARQDCQLGASVQTIDVIGGIGFCESGVLRLAQSVRKRGTLPARSWSGCNCRFR